MSPLLHLGDCLHFATGLPSVADASVDHVITDPPYDAHVDANSVRGKGHRPGGKLKALGFEPITVDHMERLGDQFARVARRWVIVFCAVEQVSAWKGALTSAGLDYVRCGAWLKDNATPQFTGDRPATGFEAIVICHQPGRKRWNGGGRLGVWRTSTAYREGDDVSHPTQKPVVLLEALIRDFTDHGESVLDPFAGSGTTGVAALHQGRNFIGWEMDPVHHATATKRLSVAKEQLCLPVGRRKPRPKQKEMPL